MTTAQTFLYCLGWAVAAVALSVLAVSYMRRHELAGSRSATRRGRRSAGGLPTAGPAAAGTRPETRAARRLGR